MLAPIPPESLLASALPEPAPELPFPVLQLPGGQSAGSLVLSFAAHLFLLGLMGLLPPQPIFALPPSAPPEVVLETTVATRRTSRFLPPIYPARAKRKPHGPGGRPGQPLPRLGAEAPSPQAIVSNPENPNHWRQTLLWQKRLEATAPAPSVPALPNIVIASAFESSQATELDPARLEVPGAPVNLAQPAHSARFDRGAGTARLALPSSPEVNPLARLSLSPALPGEHESASDAPPGPASSGDLALPGVVALSASPGPATGPIRLPGVNLQARFSAGPTVGPGSPRGVPGGALDGQGGDEEGPGGPGGSGEGMTVPGIYVPPAGPPPPVPAVVVGGAPVPANGAGHHSTAAPPPGRKPGERKPKSRKVRRAPSPEADSRPERVRSLLAQVQADEQARETGRPGGRAGERLLYSTYIFLQNLTSQSSTWLLHYREADTANFVAGGEGGTVTAPQVVRKADPCYPSDTHWQRPDGTVVLYGVITAEGTVTDVSVAQGLDPRIDSRAAEAFAHSRFEPARKNGRPVALEVIVEIPFRLAPCM